MIRHQVKIQYDPMLNALETGKRRAKRSLLKLQPKELKTILLY